MMEALQIAIPADKTVRSGWFSEAWQRASPTSVGDRLIMLGASAECLVHRTPKMTWHWKV